MALSATLGVGMVLAGPAPADIYWAAQHTNREPSPIGCARDNGSRVNPKFMRGVGFDVHSLSADGRYVYWADDARDSIGRAKTNGRKVKRKLIRDAGVGFSLASDGDSLYWDQYPGYSIARAGIDGTDVDRAFIPDASGPLAVGGGRIVYRDSEGIESAAIDGSGVTLLYSFLDDGNPGAVATNGAHAFWMWNSEDFGSPFDPFKISRVNTDGTDFVEEFVPRVDVYDVAADDKHVYWADPLANAIGRVNVDGTRLKRKFIRVKDAFRVAVGPGSGCPRRKQRR